MACGTPVAATLVGLVSNLVEDEFTGFILENNSPECIAFAITRALEYPKLDLISSNARELIEKEYTYDATIVRYRKLFEIIQ
jgi:Glycosyltransferase